MLFWKYRSYVTSTVHVLSVEEILNYVRRSIYSNRCSFTAVCTISKFSFVYWLSMKFSGEKPSRMNYLKFCSIVIFFLLFFPIYVLSHRMCRIQFPMVLGTQSGYSIENGSLKFESIPRSLSSCKQNKLADFFYLIVKFLSVCTLIFIMHYMYWNTLFPFVFSFLHSVHY